jgi:hypothetical protein
LLEKGKTFCVGAYKIKCVLDASGERLLVVAGEVSHLEIEASYTYKELPSELRARFSSIKSLHKELKEVPSPRMAINGCG